MLETERLLLRAQRADDAPLLRRLWEERDPRAPAHRRVSSDGRPTIEDLAESVGSERNRRLLTVVVRESGEAIGYCGLIPYRDGLEAELAYELRRSAHGLGYATEAARAVLAGAASEGHARLWATVRDWNAPSRRVLEKLGFREVGMEPDPIHGDSILTVIEL